MAETRKAITLRLPADQADTLELVAAVDGVKRVRGCARCHCEPHQESSGRPRVSRTAGRVGGELSADPQSSSRTVPVSCLGLDKFSNIAQHLHDTVAAWLGPKGHCTRAALAVQLKSSLVLEVLTRDINARATKHSGLTDRGSCNGCEYATDLRLAWSCHTPG